MTTLFVGNLSPDVTDGDLRAVFEAFGRVQSIRLVTRRRTAYVELDPETASSALDGLRGTQLKGRTLDIAVEQSGGRPGKRRNRGR